MSLEGRTLRGLEPLLGTDPRVPSHQVFTSVICFPSSRFIYTPRQNLPRRHNVTLFSDLPLGYSCDFVMTPRSPGRSGVGDRGDRLGLEGVGTYSGGVRIKNF